MTATGTHIFGLDVWVPSGSPGVIAQAAGGSATYTNNGATSSTVKDQWQRLYVTVTVTVVGTIQVGVVNNQATTAGMKVWTDAWQYEQKGYVTSYCDGSLGNGYAWTGAAHASTSTRTAGLLQHALPTTLAPQPTTRAIGGRPPFNWRAPRVSRRTRPCSSSRSRRARAPTMPCCA